MSKELSSGNPYLAGPLGAVFIKTALPIIFVMGMNGAVTLIDALFLGLYVGPKALAAVTLMFPIFMLLVALSTLVSSGMASQVARFMGGTNHEQAQAAFVGAHGLAWFICALLISGFALFGADMALLFAGGSAGLGDMGHLYMRILIFWSPLMFSLALNSDAMRCEGHLGLMAGVSLMVSLLNIVFNYLLIARLEMGVAGSAYGTILAQCVALACVLAYRTWGTTQLRLTAFGRHAFTGFWRPTLALGLPPSLSFLGVSLISAAILTALQMVDSPTYADTVTAYGIITRVSTFVFLPLLGLSHAMQAVVGNNFGAQLWQRSNRGLGLGIASAFAYCLLMQAGLTFFAGPIGRLFVADAAVIGEIERIMPVMVALLAIGGPLMMLSSYFQAIGKAAQAAILGLVKPYLFAIPLVFLMPIGFGEPGIWLAGPVAELCLLALTAATLVHTSQWQGLRWGLFRQA
ncbi:MATE family efflux transporter [Kordiimonas lacus]|uniref:Multidrug export protein MepA n=1 Tax=Kordiimonas lacus TaxID=637679 RepID=A0A1G6U3Q2_9PROT|nr:MATE family efflux transporter [Kordiimonas lacus]SDD35316.1 putative efflux protein, MATE family [Kordiimonas lacus]